MTVAGAREWLRSPGSRFLLRCCDHVGPGARVQGRPHVQNLGRIEIGEDFLLRSEPARSHLVAGPAALLSIGSGVRIGEGAGVAAHGRIVVGDRTSIGPYALVMDTNFHKTGDWHSRAKPGSVEIGRDVRIGARVIVLPGSVIGDGAAVKDGGVVSGRIPPGTHVAGVPARRRRAAGSRRGDTAARALETLREAFDLPSVPALDAAPADVPGWNLLGGLRLLLDLEDEFGVAIPDDAWRGVRRVQDAVAVVSAAVGDPARP